jgi:putative transposase
MTLFGQEADFEAFQRIMTEAHRRHPIRILAYCILSKHWHFVVWPETDGQVAAYFGGLAHTHAMRWRVAHRTVRYGHLYQGRFKSFPVQGDGHLLTVLRYVERKVLDAGLVERAEDWLRGSLWARRHRDAVSAVLSPLAGGTAEELDRPGELAVERDGAGATTGEHRTGSTVRR